MLFIAVVAAFLTAFAYFYWFKTAEQGGPSSWSQFGDYFSGLLNPIIGIITVVLIVLTLRTTRREAADTRYQMESQIEHLQKQSVLNDMQKRLEGTLAEWNRILDQMAPGQFQRMYLSAGSHHTTEYTIRAVLENNERWSKLFARAQSARNEGQEFYPEEWKDFKHDLVPLLCELDEYCVAYERESGSHHLTAFYKARVRQGLRVLHLAGTMPTSVAERLLGKAFSHMNDEAVLVNDTASESPETM